MSSRLKGWQVRTRWGAEWVAGPTRERDCRGLAGPGWGFCVQQRHAMRAGLVTVGGGSQGARALYVGCVQQAAAAAEKEVRRGDT